MSSFKKTTDDDAPASNIGPHATDSGGERDLHKEANSIKQSLTAPPPVTSQSQYDVEFSTILESSDIGNGLQKNYGPKSFVQYVPDFFYSLLTIQQVFSMISLEKFMKNDVFCMATWTLYHSYALFYCFLKTVAECNPNLKDFAIELKAFREAGFDDCPVVAYLHSWISGLGKTIAKDIARFFVPKMPSFEESQLELEDPNDPDSDLVEKNSWFSMYFLNRYCGHLLPNFRLLISAAYFFSPNEIGGVPSRYRSRAYFIAGEKLPNSLWFDELEGARNAIGNIPGVLNCLVHNSLPSYFTDMLTGILNNDSYPTTLSRYLQLNPIFLNSLVNTMRQAFLKIPHVSTSLLNTAGSMFVELALKDVAGNDLLLTDYKEGEKEYGKNLKLPAVVVDAILKHRGSVICRHLITNGEVFDCKFVPLVRSSCVETRVVIDGQPKPWVEPTDVFWTDREEFVTVAQNVEEALSALRRKK